MRFAPVSFFCSALFVVTCSCLFSQERRISSEIFCDYFYEFSHPDSATDALERNGFRFTRLYFTYDHNLSENFAARFRLEMNSPDFGKAEQIVPFVKHAYLRWEDVIPQGRLFFGLSSTPTWNISEAVWGYRSVEKTIMDLRKAASAADLGLALQGRIGRSGVLNYHVMAANGTGTKGETDKNKKLYLNLSIEIEKSYLIVPYFDYESGLAGNNKHTIALFAGVRRPNVHGGVEVFWKTSSKALDGNRDRTESGLSVFGAIKAAREVKVFGRLDRYDPDTKVAANASTFLIAGVDVAPAEDVNVIPNLKVERYQAAGRRANIVAALTFFYRL